MLGCVNSFVHAIMYTYYLQAALKLNLLNSTWWKKLITQIQILQFVGMIIHFGGPLLFPVIDCKFPKYLLILGVTQNTFMLFMFIDFYIKAYVKPKKLKE